MNSRHSGLHEAAGIVLEEHQVELLRTLVEAQRSVEPRRGFWVTGATIIEHRSEVRHPGLAEPLMVTEADLRTLARVEFIDLVPVRGLWKFSITPRGVKYYADVLQRRGQPAERVEQAIRRLIDSEGFKGRFQAAYAKWAKAEELLWGADAQSQLTTIGHHCREAAQDFATALVGQYQPSTFDPDPAKTKNRLRAVVEVRRPSFGESVTELLTAMVDYWSALVDLHQRQEHGAQREGQPLTWEDGRRVVFQTLLVMVELDRALNARAR